jgi:hypothetical protein
MTTYAIGGQSSGDFRETSSRVQLLHVVTRNAVGVLTPDAFTQANPPNVTTEVSTTLATITKVGVLGGTYAFTRPDYGNGFHGGPPKPSGSYTTGSKTLGIFMNDSIGNAYENTPGVASGRGPYVSGVGGTVGNSLYETKVQITQGGNTAGTAITYAAGNLLYASVNGLVTNTVTDSYEQNAPSWASTNPTTIVGVVKVAPDANSSLLVYDTRI